MREDEDVARAMAFNVNKYKLLALPSAHLLPVPAAQFFAARPGNDLPRDFTLLVSINVLGLNCDRRYGKYSGIVHGFCDSDGFAGISARSAAVSLTGVWIFTYHHDAFPT